MVSKLRSNRRRNVSGYIAIIALLNGLVSGAFSLLSGGAIKWDFQTLIGFVFAPLAFLFGVPWEDIC